VAKLFHFIQE